MKQIESAYSHNCASRPCKKGLQYRIFGLAPERPSPLAPLMYRDRVKLEGRRFRELTDLNSLDHVFALLAR